MTYKRFEDLPVWQDAGRLAVRIYRLTRDRSFHQSGDLTSQLRRAALPVSNNIAEGFERGTTGELITFIYIARGSAGEVRSMLQVMDRMEDFGHLKSQISNPSPRASPVNSASGRTACRIPTSPDSVT